MQGQTITLETKTKKEIQAWLKLMGWFTFPVLQGLGAHKGITDIIAIKKGVTLFIEVKAPKGRQSEHQQLFEYCVRSHGGHYILARGYEDIDHYITEKRLS